MTTRFYLNPRPSPMRGCVQSPANATASSPSRESTARPHHERSGRTPEPSGHPSGAIVEDMGRTRVLVLGAAIVSGFWSCGGDRDVTRGRRSSGEPAASAARGPSWELVYEQEVEGNVDLYLVPTSGGVPRRLTTHPREDLHARWTPDGRRIIFTSNRTGNPQLWELTPDHGGLRRIRSNEAEESQPDPSPDGRRLAFLSDHEGPLRLLVADIAGGSSTELVRHGPGTIFGNPHWSPDGALIAFSSNWRIGHHIYVVDVASRDVRRVVGGCEPRFTRDGRRVAYVSREHARPSVSRLVERDLETGEERVVVDWPALNYDAAYSPDGSEVAFASNIAGEWAIFRQRLSDGRAWRLTFGGGPARYPDYRPRTPRTDP
jgi:Tol biopolymer transport system component